MDFQQLRTFYIVAKVGSFSKAVAELNLSQPAISRQIMLLEHQLKARLFNRHARRGLVLTPEGETLLQKTQDILKDVDALKSCLRQHSEPHGRCKIVASHIHVASWLMPVVSQFMKLYPNVAVQLICSDDIADLSMREADIYIGSVKNKLPEHAYDKLFSVKFNLYAAPSYVRMQGMPQDIHSLSGHRLIQFNSQDMYYDLFDVRLQEVQKRSGVLTLNCLDAMISATQSGIGIGMFMDVLPTSVCKDFLPVLKDHPRKSMDVYCSYLDKAAQHVNVKSFLHVLHKSVETLQQVG